MPACKSWMKYAWEGHYCENPPWPQDPEGLCILHSLKPEKDKETFAQAVGEKLARPDYDFREVYFPHPVSFAKQKFTQPANFRGARFAGWADFRESEFLEGADFSHARFPQAAIFERVRFARETSFQGAEMLGEADFRGAAVEGSVTFQQVNESRGAGPRPAFTASFRYVSFGSEGFLRFQDLSLSQVSFLGADLRRVNFHNVRWHAHRGRQVIYDEALLGRIGLPAALDHALAFDHTLSYEDTCARVEELYRYLKLNYEQEGDLKQAGDFHYGEMEMHRRANPWRRWFPFSWYNLYGALSGYGERPLRALAWLLGLLGGLAAILSHSGLQTTSGGQAGWGAALIYLLQQATLIHPDWAIPATSGGNLLGALSRILLPAQAALFILALRNRLGRRR